MFFRLKKNLQPIEIGTHYRRRYAQTVETVEVVDIFADPSGVPHIRFTLAVEREQVVSRHYRTLSDETFRDLYLKHPDINTPT